jgi:C4-type Zn-finger protein
MSVQAPIDPPDEGGYQDGEWECPDCGQFTATSEWVEVVGRYHAIITTICNVCEYSKTDEDSAYGYDG